MRKVSAIMVVLFIAALWTAHPARGQNAPAPTPAKRPQDVPIAIPVPSPGSGPPPPQQGAPPPGRLPGAISPLEQGKSPPIKLVAPGVFEIGGVQITKKENKVTFPCKVNMSRGLLEYVIVGRMGKLHESLLMAEVEPFPLQVALLLMGLEGSMHPLAHQGDPRKPEGDPVEIWVQWDDGGQTRKARIEDWVAVAPDLKPMQNTNWIFTGSYTMAGGAFMAQTEKSIVAIYHDPAALFDNPSPEGASDKVWFVNEAKVPPVGTPVTVIVNKAE